jgi:hypothetical protein
MEKLQWSALEYEEKERSRDWFWALGIIVATSSIASIIFGNYFFATLLLISGLLLGFFAIKKPDLIPYELNSKGLKIRTQLYPYNNMKSFWVETSGKPTLFIKTERAFMPMISIPIDEYVADDIRSILLGEDVPEEKMQEHASLKIMDSLGF